jgi:hypothetical protein
MSERSGSTPPEVVIAPIEVEQARTLVEAPNHRTDADKIREEIAAHLEEKMRKWREAKRKDSPFVTISVAEEVAMRQCLFQAAAAERGLPLCPVHVSEEMQTLKGFLERAIPPKEPLVDGLLYRRDIVALAGRRRHGKTTFTGNLVLALTVHNPDFLGYRIPNAAKVLVFFLEDDAGELQLKLRRMCRGSIPTDRLALYTREDFYRMSIPIDAAHGSFQAFVVERCSCHHPDVIVIDNLAHMIGADYNNSKVIHRVNQFVWQLTKDFNAAVIILAHPRKRDKKLDAKGSKCTARLRDDPEGFFEEVMGSSHFVNSCGSLWAIERDVNTDETDFLGGTQRLTGQHTLMTLDKDEHDWFSSTTDLERNLELALNTQPRKTAWILLPNATFTYTEAEKSVKAAMKSSSTFNGWFNLLKRLGLVVAEGEGYRKTIQSEL